MKEIIQCPNPLLRQVSKPAFFNSSLVSLVQDMKEIIEPYPGRVGISAPQIGVLRRVIVVRYGAAIVAIVNPVIIKHSMQTYTNHEGCLSVSHGQTSHFVKRYRLVKVRGFDTEGKSVTYKGRDLFGAVLQHEIDHLDGKLIINQGGSDV